MSSLKKIREKFGISQQQVAHWLGISRSLAEHYENGTRSLPTKALLQLAKLEMMLVEFEKGENGSQSRNVSWDTNHGDTELEKKEKDPELETPGSIQDNIPVHPRLAFQLDKAERLQQQLSVLKTRHMVLQQQMLLIKKLMDNCDEYTNEKEKLWLQMLYHGVCCKLSKFDESKQLPLKAKIMEMRIRHGLMNKKAG